MSEHIHYVIVRRDLPLGVMAAMITHAAGESASHRLWPLPPHTIAVVLQVNNEEELIGVGKHLKNQSIPYVSIYESGGIYHNQFMSIGVLPGNRDRIGPSLIHLAILRDRDEVDNYDDQC